MIPMSLAEVPSLHWLTRYWGHESCNSDEQKSMLRLRELLKNTYVREPVVWSSTRKGQVHIGSGVSAPGGETGCTLWVAEQLKLLFAAHSTKHSPLDVLALYPPLHM